MILDKDKVFFFHLEREEIHDGGVILVKYSEYLAQV